MTTHHAHHRTPRWLFALLLAALATIGPFAVDTYMPAFGGMSQDLHATTLEMQQTLSVYLGTFAFMFLFHGALSDSYGRKPVILVGLSIFAIASVGCALSQSIGQLIFFRALQGASVGAGMVVGRAMIRDLFDNTEAQKMMSMVTLWFGLAPAVAPILGGHLYTWFGWQSIFWFMAAITLILMVMSHFGFHETLPEERRHSFRPRPLLLGYREVGASPKFLLLSLAVGLNFNGFFLYILSAPVFLPEHLKLGPQQYAWLFLPGIVGIMTGAYLSGRAAGKPGVPCAAVDKAARDVIKAAGYGKYFTHRTGHGIGMEGHEDPYMRGDNMQLLEPGMAYTVEPGIYLPNRNGVRIEDNVVITESGADILTSYPKSLVRG